MQVTTKNGAVKRQVLIGMVVDKTVCGAVSARWDGHLFGSMWEDLVAGWCVDYYREHGKPPNKAIETMFDRWAERSRDKETTALVERFLRALSSEYQRNGHGPSPKFLIDQAAIEFNKTRLLNIKEKIEDHLTQGDVAKAWKCLNDARPVEIGTGVGINLVKDKEKVKAAFESCGEKLITWPQPALTNFFDTLFARGEFISFMGKEKVGKSFWLQEVAWQGWVQHRNVAFFETGDQSEFQLIRRFGARAARRPFKKNLAVRYPTSIELDGKHATVDFEERQFEEPLTYEQAMKALERVGKKHGDDRLRMSVHHNSSISVHGIDEILTKWKRDDGWVPDIIVIDYADILAPINGTADTRDQINSTWKAARGLNQKWDTCLVWATQADAGSYVADTLSRRNFSEDKRKHAHVTAMVGINQVAEEQKTGVTRLNIIHGRDLEFSEETCVHCAGCLPFANPCVLATL